MVCMTKRARGTCLNHKAPATTRTRYRPSLPGPRSKAPNVRSPVSQMIAAHKVSNASGHAKTGSRIMLRRRHSDTTAITVPRSTMMSSALNPRPSGGKRLNGTRTEPSSRESATRSDDHRHRGFGMKAMPQTSTRTPTVSPATAPTSRATIRALPRTAATHTVRATTDPPGSHEKSEAVGLPEVNSPVGIDAISGLQSRAERNPVIITAGRSE